MMSMVVVAMSSCPLDSGSDDDDAPLGAGDRTSNEQQPALDVNAVNLQVLHGLAVITHATSHPVAPEAPSWRGRTTDGTGLTVVALRAVRSDRTAEAVTLHHTSSALALGGAGDIHFGAGLEYRCVEFLAELVGVRI